MKSFTAAATVVAGAALFAKSAYAQLPPIVIKVGRSASPVGTMNQILINPLSRAPNSSIRTMELNCEYSSLSYPT